MVFGLPSVVQLLFPSGTNWDENKRKLWSQKPQGRGEGRAHAASGSTRPMTILGANKRHLRYMASLSHLESFSSFRDSRQRGPKTWVWTVLFVCHNNTIITRPCHIQLFFHIKYFLLRTKERDVHFQSFSSLFPKLVGRDRSAGCSVRSDADLNAGLLLPILWLDNNFLPLKSKPTDSKSWTPNHLLEISREMSSPAEHTLHRGLL